MAVGLVGLVTAAAALTGCSGNKADVAAQVAGTDISVATFNETVQEGIDDPVVGKLVKKAGKAYRSQVLTFLIKEQLVTRLLKANDITYTAAQIDEFEKQNLGGLAPEEAQAQAAKSGQPYTRAELRKLAIEYYMYAELGKKKSKVVFDAQVAKAVAALKAKATTYDLSVIYLTSAAEQQTALQQLQSGATTIAALGATLPAASDGTPQPQSQKAFDPSGLDQSTPDLAALIRGSSVGQFLPYDNGTTFLIVAIDNITTQTDAELQAAAETQVNSTLGQAGQAEAAKQAKKYDVYVNPRFGTLERPTESLPSVTGSTPDTFTVPGKASASATSAPAVAPAA